MSDVAVATMTETEAATEANPITADGRGGGSSMTVGAAVAVEGTAKKIDRNSNRKRKRCDPGQPKDSRRQQDQDNYYERLLHSAQKAIRREAKVVRNFECQKYIRKIKERKQEDKETTTTSSSNEKKTSSSTEEAYQQLKSLDLDLVVQESLRRLGIRHLDPKLRVAQKLAAQDTEEEDESNDKNNNSGETTEQIQDENTPKNGSGDSSSKVTPNDAQVIILSEPQKSLVEKILKHKKMQSASEHWNEQVTEYRRWSLRLLERDSQSSSSALPGLKKNGKKHKDVKTGPPQAAATAPGGGGGRAVSSSRKSEKSLFVQLGDPTSAAGDDERRLHYGPGSFVEEIPKKNRRGQRARKAKAAAMEAQLAGRTHRTANSLNWRPKKHDRPSEGGGTATGKDYGGPTNARKRESKSKPDPSDEALHPSWAAAKKESAGIVKFQGTKITFE